jgi:hypothetical protein
MRWEGYIARMEKKRNEHRILVGKPEGKTALEIPRRNWEDNVVKGVRETEWGYMNWIDLVQDRDHWQLLVNNTAMNLGLLEKVGKFLSN